MGFKTEINFVLKLDEFKEKLVEDKVYDFKKNELRIYPINIPIFLANKKWEILAAVSILETTAGSDQTCGKFKVVKVYEGQQKSTLTKTFQDLSIPKT